MADNQPQQRDQDVVVYSTFSGVRNDVTPERFGISDLEIAVNVDLDKTGRMARRDGFASVSGNAAHSLWASPDQSVCLFVEDPYLKRLEADYTSTTLRSLAGTGRMSFVAVNDCIFFSNGVDVGVLQDGYVRSWGMPTPPALGVTVKYGNLPAGRYQFAMTYVRVDGQESGAGLASVVDVPAGSALVFDLPVSGDPGVVAKRLYLSTPDGDMMFDAALVQNSISALTYEGDTLTLTRPLEAQFSGPAPAGQLVAYYRGRMFVAAGDVIYVSDPYAYERFDLRNYLQLDGRVTLLAPMEDKESAGTTINSGFFVGTEKSCGVIVGADPTDFQYVPKTRYGAIPGAIDYVDGSVFGDNSLGARQMPMWLTTEGICIGKPNMVIQNLTRTKFGFTATGQGAAIFMPGPNRFIVSSNS